MKFLLTIEEMVSQDFEVDAEDEKEALEIAIDKYKKGIFVLEPGEVKYRQILINTQEEKVSAWVEF